MFYNTPLSRFFSCCFDKSSLQMYPNNFIIKTKKQRKKYQY